MNIKNIISKWVLDNYGESELNEPSWNIDLLAEHIESQLKNKTDKWLDILNYWADHIQDLGERYDDLHPMYVKYEKTIDEIYNLTKGSK